MRFKWETRPECLYRRLDKAAEWPWQRSIRLGESKTSSFAQLAQIEIVVFVLFRGYFSLGEKCRLDTIIVPEPPFPVNKGHPSAPTISLALVPGMEGPLARVLVVRLRFFRRRKSE